MPASLQIAAAPSSTWRKRRGAQRVDRPGDEAQRVERRGAHGVDVGERVGGGDAAVVVGVVDDRREDVDRLDQGEIVAQLDDGGVVGRVVADQHARIGGDRQAASALCRSAWLILAAQPAKRASSVSRGTALSAETGFGGGVATFMASSERCPG